MLYILILAGMTNVGAYVVHDYNSDGFGGFSRRCMAKHVLIYDLIGSL